MSIVLKPNLSLAEASKLTLATGVAVVDALREMFSLKVGIKWPNDVIYEGKKLAGILAEVVGEWTTIQTMVIGIGVNANLKREDLSPDLPAASLRQILGQEIDLNRLAARILEHLELELKSLEAEGFGSLRERWTERAIGIGRECLVERNGQTLTGILRGISEDGELIMQVGEKEYKFSAGEVRLRATSGKYF